MARNIACMAETMRLRPDGATRVIDVGFYVLAPREQIDKGVFDTHMTRESIEATPGSYASSVWDVGTAGFCGWTG